MHYIEAPLSSLPTKCPRYVKHVPSSTFYPGIDLDVDVIPSQLFVVLVSNHAAMSVVEISQYTETAEVKIISAFQELVNAVENFDLEQIIALLPKEQGLHLDLTKVFNAFREQGYNSFKAISSGHCGCMLGEPYNAVDFNIEKDLAAPGKVYIRQFGFIFIQDKQKGGYKFFKLCAHMNWKAKYDLIG